MGESVAFQSNQHSLHDQHSRAMLGSRKDATTKEWPHARPQPAREKTENNWLWLTRQGKHNAPSVPSGLAAGRGVHGGAPDVEPNNGRALRLIVHHWGT
eukprot:3099542-Pyramimonas_sp.AAC.1